MRRRVRATRDSGSGGPLPSGATRAELRVVGGNVPGAPRLRLAWRRCPVASPAFVSPREPCTLPRPTPSPLIHSCPGARAREGRGLALRAPRVVSWGARRGFAHSPFKRGQPVPRAVVSAPGCPYSLGASRPGPIVSPPGHALLSLARGRCGRAIGVAIRLRGRSERVRRASTHGGRSGRWHWWSGRMVIATPNSFLSWTQPSALVKCLPPANKGNTPAPSLPAPTCERERECARPSGFSVLKPSDLGLRIPPR